MKRLTYVIIVLFSLVSGLLAQGYRVVDYDESDGLSQRHVTQILQDNDGFIWLATWNGLDRFDGREFVNFKTKPGDNCDMPTDRIRNITLDGSRKNVINCKVDNRWYRFSLVDGTFSTVSDRENRAIDAAPKIGTGKFMRENDSVRFQFADRQGNIWQILNEQVRRLTPSASPIRRLAEVDSEVKWMGLDRYGRHWVCMKGSQRVVIYDKTNRLVGYLAPDGRISGTPTAFPSPVYCMYQSRNGDVWLGTKPDGVYRLQEENGRYRLTHYAKGDVGLNSDRVYDICEDSYGRIWLATMGGGINCFENGRFTHYLFGRDNQVRRIYRMDNDTLMAATTEGLLVMKRNKGGRIEAVLNKKEAGRANSLSCSACMSVLRFGGRYFVATESGGVNEILSPNLMTRHLEFRHYDKKSGLNSDVIMSMVPFGRNILLVSSNQLMLLDPRSGETSYFSNHFFQEKLNFSDAAPLRLDDGTWIFGLMDGAFTIAEERMSLNDYLPPLVLTGITIENEEPILTVNHLTELNLNPEQRTVTVSFAALDYRDPGNIKYAYRMAGDADWHYLGNANRVSLPELSPGSYRLEIRCSNADGRWSRQVRKLIINVKPKFIETVWFDLLVILLLAGLAVFGAWLFRYIRRIKQQKERLEAYLALIEQKKDAPTEAQEDGQYQKTLGKLSSEDEAFMKKVMEFVETHIGDADVNISDMALFTATSRSGLNRKMKMLIGLTPADFIREARIKRACQMLEETRDNVSEIAYRCGFTDPKYFSRCFKASVGMTPSEFRKR